METDRQGQRPGPKVRSQDGAWTVRLAMIGRLVASVPLASVSMAAAATGGIGGAIAAGAVAIGVAAFMIGENLRQWGSSDTGAGRIVVPRERIQRERHDEGFEADALHVAICGPSGSGKSSLVNALRGVLNGTQEAASTGTVETTLTRTSYSAHNSLGALFVHDVPGAGTLRFRAEDYYYKQKLYLYDSVLIVQGERFGQIEINLIRACICQGQSFVVVRSRSDELINRITRDENCDAPRARQRHMESTVASIRDELERSDASSRVLAELSELLVLVNDNDLRRLTVQDSREWPEPADAEINERTMLKFLGKAGLNE